MTKFTITLTGLKEVQEKLNRITQGKDSTNRNIITEACNYCSTELQNNAHVWTGRMKASIGVGSVTNTTGEVHVNVPYAAIENARPGTKEGYGRHNFADRAINSTADKFPSIALKHWEELLKKS